MATINTDSDIDRAWTAQEARLLARIGELSGQVRMLREALVVVAPCSYLAGGYCWCQMAHEVARPTPEQAEEAHQPECQQARAALAQTEGQAGHE